MREKQEKTSFIVNFFYGIESIIDFAVEAATILFYFLSIAVAVMLLLTALGAPFYGLAGYVTNIPGKRVAISIPFTLATILFIAWIGSKRAKWNS